MTVAVDVVLTTTATAVGAPGAAVTTVTPAADVGFTALTAATTKVYVPPGVRPDTAHVNEAPAATEAHGVSDCPAAVSEPVAVTA